MRVKVKLLSVFAEHDRSDAEGFTAVRDGATVRDLAGTLGLPIDLVRIITINGRQAALDDPLGEEDLVYLFPPALGGG